MLIKPVIASMLGALILAAAQGIGAVQTETVSFGKAEVIADYGITESGLATLTLNALIDETNNSLRGLKNTDPRRLSKLGQLIYQCKLMLYRPAGRGASSTDHLLISRNYSLYTGVDLSLAADERLGLRVQALRRVDEASLFSTTLGSADPQNRLWEAPSRQGAANLRQVDVNILQESDVVETSESIEIAVRFPVFQLAKPVREWRYNFDLGDFRRAVRHVDQHCTPARLESLLDGNS